jgi:tyrosyl-tRNA synthetase
LIGGATGLIGDPKPGSERELLTLDDTLKNGEAIAAQVRKMIDADMVNNYDWTSKIDMITFLRDFGKNFNVNYMLAKDTVKSRLETGISYTEFSYQILQALDWKHLFETKNCQMQVGGQDQWGNITAGTELIRKEHGSEATAIGFTWPLVTKSDGTKFGKTEGGAVWLDPVQTTPYEFYQFWINTPDADAMKFLKWFTFLDRKEIEAIEEEFKAAPHQRAAQKRLAEEVTKFVHGEEALSDALRITEALFQGNIKALSADEIEASFKDVPSADINGDILLIDALIACKGASSKREARQFITGNAVRVNGDVVSDLEHVVKLEDLIGGRFAIIRRGKKKYFMLKALN